MTATRTFDSWRMTALAVLPFATVQSLPSAPSWSVETARSIVPWPVRTTTGTPPPGVLNTGRSSSASPSGSE